MCELLQHGCTLVGVPLILLLLAGWLYRQSPGSLAERPMLSGATKLAVYLIAVATPVVVASLVLPQRGLPRDARLFFWVTFSGLALMVEAITFCVAFQAIDGRLASSK